MICFKFPDEATAKTALSVYVDESGEWILASHDHALDPCGTLYSVDINDPTIQTPINGWHLNLIGEYPAEAEAYLVHPVTPSRVFA